MFNRVSLQNITNDVGIAESFTTSMNVYIGSIDSLDLKTVTID